MISLDDDELAIVTELARPLPPERRSEFLAAVMQAAAQHEVVGPGLISRIAAEMQKSFFFRMPATHREAAGATRQHEHKRRGDNSATSLAGKLAHR
jgi:hypothetical protein